ncbi:MAG: outer membrane beta-barrel protein [Bacteroidia bacterium]
MYRQIVFLLLWTLGALTSTAYAQVSVRLSAGLISGSPIGAIPEGATGDPGLRLWAGTALEYRFAERLGLRLGIGINTKASQYDAPVSGEQQAEANIYGAEIRLPFAFDYEGNVRGRFVNRYVQVPLTIAYYNESRWIPYGGFYWARNIRPYHKGTVNVVVSNGIVEIRNQSFDETAGLRGWDWGAIVGTDLKIIDEWGLSLELQYGLISILETNPQGLDGSFRNLYIQAGTYVRLGKQGNKNK